jgi:hypothetical protein
MLALIWGLLFIHGSVYADSQSYNFNHLNSTPAFSHFNSSQLAVLEQILKKQFEPAVEPAEWNGFRARYLAFLQGESTQWTTLDQAVLALAHLPENSFSHIFAQKHIEDIVIITERPVAPVIEQACQGPQLNHSVRGASCLAVYAMERTPVFIFSPLVTELGGSRVSALSSIIAHLNVVFEAYRPDTYTELIQIHEAFHSSMRLLGNQNRLARLKKWLPQPLVDHWDYDPMISFHIDRMENESAPHLESLAIDARFTSDHHGVIMSTLHHGLYQSVNQNKLDHPHPLDLQTDYPFNYIQVEQGWDEATKEQHQLRLHQLLDQHLSQGQLMEESLGYLMSILPALG